jgi:hypothetical protein
MFDCANVEMRELLPDLVAGALDAATRARVEQHIAGCTECASELETLRLVRSAFGTAPSVDVAGVVAALPRPNVPIASRRQRAAPVKRWLDWRVAAALTTITVGTLSLAVTQRISSRSGIGVRDTAVSAPTAAPVVIPSNRPAETPGTTSTTRREPTRATREAEAPAVLSFGGGVSDLDDSSIRALLGALDEIDRAPVAPSAEPDRTPVLPVIKEGRP